MGCVGSELQAINRKKGEAESTGLCRESDLGSSPTRTTQTVVSSVTFITFAGHHFVSTSGEGRFCTSGCISLGLGYMTAVVVMVRV